ncbi:MAG: DedA family protein [Proteobacteria bacterium]|nr:DedA family protein [Pseudomonadota bacterium]MBU1737499.1 DedA family protein [Pseudomonadota bacterium]
MDWLKTPYGVWVLFLVAVAESSFFPIPPDVFLMALCISSPERSFRYGAICTAGSVLGGILGYALGFWFMDLVGARIIEIYGLGGKYELVQGLYQKYDAWAVGAAGFTPLPYKLFTITAGAFRIDFSTFVIVSFFARSARFAMVAGLIYFFGAPIRSFIERYLNILTIIFLVLLVLGFAAVKWLL